MEVRSLIELRAAFAAGLEEQLEDSAPQRTLLGALPLEDRPLSRDELEAARARTYYGSRAHFNKYGNVELDWRVEVAPWAKGCTVSDYVREQEARKEGIDPSSVDLRLVFDEPVPVTPPGERSRPSSLAERTS